MKGKQPHIYLKNLVIIFLRDKGTFAVSFHSMNDWECGMNLDWW